MSNEGRRGEGESSIDGGGGSTQRQLQLQQREFSSIYPFKIKIKSTAPNIHDLTNLIVSNGFRFESGEVDHYQPGFAKPLLFDKDILLIPFYDIFEEHITEDVTNKERPGEIKQEMKVTQTQKVQYIIDANIYAKEGLVFVCRANSLDNAQQLLAEYLQTVKLNQDCMYSFVYNQNSEILQQLLKSLYDYWPTGQSQITSIRIGGKTISARYSGRGSYDVRLEDSNEEIRKRIGLAEEIEDLTLKPPIAFTGRSGKMRTTMVPRISINEVGMINCRANINYENFVLIKEFVEETVKIINELHKGRHPRGYKRIEEFAGLLSARTSYEEEEKNNENDSHPEASHKIGIEE